MVDFTPSGPKTGGISFTPSPTPEPSLASKIWGGLSGAVSSIEQPFVSLAAAPVQALAKGLNQPDPFAKGIPAGLPGADTKAAVTPLTVKGKAGDALKAAATIGAVAAAPVTIPGAIGVGAGVGAAQGAGDALQQDKSLGDVALQGSIGAGVGAAAGLGGGLLAKGLASAPALLSHTSNTPEEAFKIITSKPEAASMIGKTPEQALKDTQGIVRGLRTQLTQGWKDATQQISTDFEGQRVGLPDKTLSLLHKIDETVGGLEHIPQNPANMSALELINLEKELNSYASKTAFKISPEGIPLKNLQDQIRDIGVNAFGGKGGSYETLYKNYSTQKGVFDAANDIVQAYKTGKPITQTTALARLQRVFDDNKPAYLLALKNLEAATGKDVTSGIAASKFTPMMPKFNKVNGDLWTKTLTLLAAPLTSPRFASYIARGSQPAANAVTASIGPSALGASAAADALTNQ